MVVAAVLAVLLAGLPLAVTAVAYAAGRGRGDTGVEPLRAAGAVRAFGHEWLAAIGLLVASPFHLRDGRADPPARGVAVFVPELYGSSATFWYLRRRLRASGWVGLPGVDRTRSTAVQDVMAALDACLAAQPPRTEFILVGHGIGGLLVRRYAEARPALQVRHVITLGTPHQGSSALPYRLVGAIAPAVAPAADNPRVDVIALYSDFDAWLQPVDDAYCPGGFNIAVSGVGHCAMLLSRRVADLIAENLAAPAPAS